MRRALSWFIDCPRDSSIDWNIMSAYFSNTNDTNDYARIFLSFVVFVSNLNAESIIDTWNVPDKTKKESNQEKEGMYNILISN